MKRFLLRIAWTCLAVIACFSAVQAQFVQNPFDLRAADTVTMVVSVSPVAATNQHKVQLDLYVFNDSNNIVGATTGFKWTNPNLNMDSARTSPLTTSGFDLIRSVYEGQNINTTNLNDRFLFGGARSGGTGVLMAPIRRLWASYYFTVSSWSTTDSIVIDTLQYNGGTVYKYVDEFNHQYKPFWTGRIVIRDPAWVPPSNLVLSKDTVFFSGTIGQPAPPGQQVTISSDNSPLVVNLVENASWLLKAPATGGTPLTTTVSVNLTSLPAGVYFDSIRVDAANALNAPKFIFVRLDLQPPLPKIKTSPTSMTFNALVGGANPASQTLTITNIGGGTMNWTATKSQPWLSLSPGSGTDSGGVIVSCDITGLTLGTRTDTILVSDPTATNTPVKVPVTLTLGSNLPMIVAENPVNHYIIDIDTIGLIFTRTFNIKNGGIGTLDFTVTENSPRIQHITPATGTAPQTESVEYKVSGTYDGLDLWDTAWVTSPQAINSPYPVVLHLHFVREPAVIHTAVDTVPLSVYECQQGAGKVPVPYNLSCLNAGGDDPVNITVTGDTTYFKYQTLGTELPCLVKFTPKQLDLPVGVYYDSVTISADNALNSPKKVIVKYSVIPPSQAPQMLVNQTNLTIPYQEESGPHTQNPLNIDNKFGGCMSWFVENNIPWIAATTDDSGGVPGEWSLNANAPGYVLGEYYDTLYVHAPTATNPIDTIPAVLRVWRFHGDWNYDGSVDIVDLTLYIRFLYLGSVELVPQPTFLVGDCDCDNHIDVVDLTWMINYLFNDGPIPCGNPY